MKLFDISQNETQLCVKKRVGPKLLAAIFMICFVVGVVVFVIMNAAEFFNPNILTWLGWLNELPVDQKQILFWILIFICACLVITMTVVSFANLFNALRGEVWVFDNREKVVTRFGKKVATFDEIKSVFVDENYRDENVAYLSIKTKSGKEIFIEKVTYEIQHVRDAARAIESFTGFAREKKVHGHLPYYVKKEED